MKTFLSFLTIGLFSVPLANARWATTDDAEVAFESVTMQYNIDKDGTYEVVTESLAEVLREGGRSFATTRIPYNSRASSVKLLEAETINGEKKTAVESEFIEDKAQASNVNGFDQHNVVSIAFPKVEIGSKLHLRYRLKTNEVPFPGHFSNRFEFGTNRLTKSYIVQLRSEMPLFFEKSDPQNKLEITQSQDKGDYLTVIKMLAPIYTRVLDEPNPSLGRKELTWVQVSNVKTYPEIAQTVANKYENILASELPEAFTRIVAIAQKQSSSVEKINTVTSELAKEVRYMGDWRPVAGGHIPRPLATIAKTKFGDCKDFASSTAAMLRKLGFKANVAWVERALQPTPLPELAWSGAFNHAIVHVVDGEKVFWIDPTNFSSFAQGLFDDIIGRAALVVDGNTSRLENIPLGLPAEGLKRGISHIALDSEGDASVRTELQFAGRAASPFTGALLKISKDQFEHFLVGRLVDENRVKWKNVGNYDLRSRITQDLTFNVQYGERYFSFRTTVGPAFALDQHAVDHLLRLETKNRVSDLFLGHPNRQESIDFVDNIKVVGTKPQDCALITPWMNVSRTLSQSENGLKISEVFETKKSLITIEELKSDVFEKFQSDLQKCFDRIQIVYKPIKPTTATLRKLSSEPPKR